MADDPKPAGTDLARAAYPILGDCLRHTQDVISRLQDRAEGTPLFLALERLRREVSAVQNGEAMSAIASERHRGRL
jgi:hypothetical protein